MSCEAPFLPFLASSWRIGFLCICSYLTRPPLVPPRHMGAEGPLWSPPRATAYQNPPRHLRVSFPLWTSMPVQLPGVSLPRAWKGCRGNVPSAFLCSPQPLSFPPFLFPSSPPPPFLLCHPPRQFCPLPLSSLFLQLPNPKAEELSTSSPLLAFPPTSASLPVRGLAWRAAGCRASPGKG